MGCCTCTHNGVPFVYIPTLQQVTDAGNVTTNIIGITGGGAYTNALDDALSFGYGGTYAWIQARNGSGSINLSINPQNARIGLRCLPTDGGVHIKSEGWDKRVIIESSSGQASIQFTETGLASGDSYTIGRKLSDDTFAFAASNDMDVNRVFTITRSGITGFGTVDLDGTPPVGRVVVKGTTNDGSTNCEVWRDSDNSNVARVDTDGIFFTSTAFRGETSLWYSYRQIDGLSVSPGASGATFTPPDANTIGGYQLDAATEYLYFETDIHDDWDGASDILITVYFEVNVDNTLGNVADTVDLQLICRMKGDAETACKTQTLEEDTTVGQSPQYKQFNVTFAIDHDDGTNPVEENDLIGFRLNLETDTSEVDDIIVNHFEIKYQSAQPNCIEI